MANESLINSEEAIDVISEMVGRLSENNHINSQNTNFKEKRAYPRKPCNIVVDYNIDRLVYSDFIKNISACGMLLEGKKALSEGQKVNMCFLLPGSPTPIKIKGDVARTSKNGAGIKFNHVEIKDKRKEKNIKNAPKKKKVLNENIIRELVIENLISSAITTLFVWGGINVAVWFFFGLENRSFLNSLSSYDHGIKVLNYGGLGIGLIMLAFGFIGNLLRTNATVWLSGLSLIGVGLWNVTHDFIASGIIQPYGYQIVKISTIWIMLGLAQIGWGGKQLFKISDLGDRPKIIGEEQKKVEKKYIDEIIRSDENIEDGLFKFSITKTSFPFFIDSTKSFTMVLLDEKAVCVENSLGDYFKVDRESEKLKLLDNCSAEIKAASGETRTIELSEKGYSFISQWINYQIDFKGIQERQAPRVGEGGGSSQQHQASEVDESVGTLNMTDAGMLDSMHLAFKKKNKK